MDKFHELILEFIKLLEKIFRYNLYENNNFTIEFLNFYYSNKKVFNKILVSVRVFNMDVFTVVKKYRINEYLCICSLMGNEIRNNDDIDDELADKAIEFINKFKTVLDYLNN